MTAHRDGTSRHWLDRVTRLVSRRKTTAGPALVPDDQAPTFAIGCGRSGTHFLVELMSATAGIRAVHLDDINHLVGDGFLHYCAWYGVPVDTGGFVADRAKLSSGDLSRHLNARFVHVVRAPHSVVRSHCVKEWYTNQLDRHDSALIPGYSYDYPVTRPHRYFVTHPLRRRRPYVVDGGGNGGGTPTATGHDHRPGRVIAG